MDFTNFNTWVDLAQLLTAFAAFGALYMTWRGWKEASKVAHEQARKSMVMSTDYSIYKEILSNVNSIQSRVSKYTSDLKMHTNIVADILNRWHGQGGYNLPTQQQKQGLIEEWAGPTAALIQGAYDLKYQALELTRILDMSGADFGNKSKIYNALWLMYHDVQRAIDEVNPKWTNLSLEDTNVKQYQWLLDETNKLVGIMEEFGSCVDDVLKHAYNKLVAEPMGKTTKVVDLTEKRRAITANGLRDNRIEDAS